MLFLPQRSEPYSKSILRTSLVREGDRRTDGALMSLFLPKRERERERRDFFFGGGGINRIQTALPLRPYLPQPAGPLCAAAVAMETEPRSAAGVSGVRARAGGEGSGSRRVSGLMKARA